MNSMIETQTGYPLFSTPDLHISSFLEDFQDRNSHLFPSTDLSFEANETAESDIPSCGQKRKRDCLYDSFSEWPEELLTVEPLDPSLDIDVISSGFIDNVSKPKKEINVTKKRKIASQKDFSQIINSDASRSSSPPFQPLEFDLESIPEGNILSQSEGKEEFSESSKLSVNNSNNFDSLSVCLNAISNIDSSVRDSMSESLMRIAKNLESGKSPVSFPKGASTSEQISASQDYLTMQTILEIPIPIPPTPEQFYPVAGIPFLMNTNSYVVPNFSIPKQFGTCKAPDNLYSSKNILSTRAAQPKFLSPQSFGQSAVMSTTQNIYTHPTHHNL